MRVPTPAADERWQIVKAPRMQGCRRGVQLAQAIYQEYRRGFRRDRMRKRHQLLKSGCDAIRDQFFVVCVWADQIPSQHPVVGAVKLFLRIRRRIDVAEPRQIEIIR